MAARAIKSDRPYAAVLVAAILLVVLLGFSRSFFLMPLFGTKPEWAAKEPIFFVHGMVMSAWYALLAYQTYLVRERSLRLHRRVGYWGAGLGAAVVVLGTYAALTAANRPGGFIGVPFTPQQFLIVPLSGILVFAILLTLAVVKRHKPASHKRLMLLASISLLGAPIARLPLMWPILPFWLDAIVYSGFTIAMAYWDISTRGKLSKEVMFGGPAIVIVTLAAIPFGGTPIWQQTAAWMMSFTEHP